MNCQPVFSITHKRTRILVLAHNQEVKLLTRVPLGTFEDEDWRKTGKTKESKWVHVIQLIETGGEQPVIDATCD